MGGERSCVIDVTVLVWVAYGVRGLTVFGFVGVSYVEVQVDLGGFGSLSESGGT